MQNSKLRLLWSLYCWATKSVAFTTRSCIPSFSLVRPISSQNLCPRHTPFGSLRTEVYSFLLHPSSKIHCSKIGQVQAVGQCAFIKHESRWIFYMVTKQKYFWKPNYFTLEQALQAMNETTSRKVTYWSLGNSWLFSLWKRQIGLGQSEAANSQGVSGLKCDYVCLSPLRTLVLAKT